MTVSDLRLSTMQCSCCRVRHCMVTPGAMGKSLKSRYHLTCIFWKSLHVGNDTNESFPQRFNFESKLNWGWKSPMHNSFIITGEMEEYAALIASDPPVGPSLY